MWIRRRSRGVRRILIHVLDDERLRELRFDVFTRAPLFDVDPGQEATYQYKCPHHERWKGGDKRQGEKGRAKE